MNFRMRKESWNKSEKNTTRDIIMYYQSDSQKKMKSKIMSKRVRKKSKTAVFTLLCRHICQYYTQEHTRSGGRAMADEWAKKRKIWTKWRNSTTKKWVWQKKIISGFGKVFFMAWEYNCKMDLTAPPKPQNSEIFQHYLLLLTRILRILIFRGTDASDLTWK